MRSLFARLALLLLTAIVLVVIISSFTASLIMRGPRPEVSMEPFARQLHVLVVLAERDLAAAEASGMVVSAEPAPGEPDRMFNDSLAAALPHIDEPRQVRVTRVPGKGATASLLLENGKWLQVQLPDFGPPPGGLKVLMEWSALIVIGSALVSIVAASKITKPLLMMERALAEIRQDGTLPHMPETGPAEIRATAQALNRLSARVKTATESRMRLVAAAGHDLRTPMTRMRLRAEFIVDENERAKWLADLEELDKIADSAIGLVREEVSRDGLQPVRLDQTIATIVAELSAIGMTIAVGTLEPATVLAGPMALTRALRNLLINAATHGGSATVSVTHTEEADVVSIEDNGPGIPPDRLDQVFEPFFRIDIARQKAFPGAGLGMAIAKEILGRFQGEIVVRNRQPHGLEQTITFRDAAATHQGAA